MDEKPKQKQYYSIKVEGLAPIIAEFRVLAEDEEEAYRMFEKQPYMVQPLSPPKPDMRKLIKKKITIKNMLTNMIGFVRSF